jgi:hypothetical protein
MRRLNHGESNTQCHKVTALLFSHSHIHSISFHILLTHIHSYYSGFPCISAGRGGSSLCSARVAAVAAACVSRVSDRSLCYL